MYMEKIVDIVSKCGGRGSQTPRAWEADLEGIKYKACWAYIKYTAQKASKAFCLAQYGLKTSLFFSLSDFHKTAPYVVTGSVDQTVKVWECR